MSFVPLGKFFPDTAPQETRSLTILSPDAGVPVGDYGYVEMFCDDRGCNCRRTIIAVLDETENRMAVIGFGWGTKAQYDTWMRTKISSQMYRELVGPCHHDGIVPSKYADYFLSFFKDELMKDKSYVERIKRHYRMVREYIAQQ